jgi:hypothetical protein
MGEGRRGGTGRVLIKCSLGWDRFFDVRRLWMTQEEGDLQLNRGFIWRGPD